MALHGFLNDFFCLLPSAPTLLLLKSAISNEKSDFDAGTSFLPSDMMQGAPALYSSSLPHYNLQTYLLDQIKEAK